VRADRLDQEVVALLRAVAAERLAPRHLVDRRVHRLDDRRREWLGDVADAEPDDVGVGVRGLVGADAAPDLGEQIACGQLGVMLVDARHGRGR
jgi:hypothetical protein